MITIYVLLVSALFPLSLWGYGEVSGFLRSHSEIASAESLDAFRKLARRNMYGALGYLLLGLPSLVLCVYSVVSQDMVGKVLLVAPMGILHLMGKRLKALEIEARALPCADHLVAEYQRIGEAWVKKALPDF